MPLPGSFARAPRTADRSLLTNQIAVATVGGQRSAWAEPVTAGLDPYRLGQILRDAASGDPQAYFALAEELEEKDLRYRAALGQRKRAVTRRSISVVPGSDAPRDQQIADFVREWVERETLRDELGLMMDAVGKGLSVCEIVWETSGGRWWPRDLVWVDPRWLDLDRGDRRTLLLRRDDGPALPLPPAKFVCHEMKDKAGLPVRGGLARPASWYIMFKQFGLRDWVVFLEAYGQPLRIGRYGPTATEDQKRTLATALRRLGSDAAAIVPESMMIELIGGERQSGGGDLYHRAVQYLDTGLSVLVMGQNLTSEVSEGSFAAATVHAGVAADLEAADAAQLAVTLNQQLIPALVGFNFGQVDRLPRLRLDPIEQANLAVLGDYLAKTVPLGLKVSQRWVREQAGMPEPADEDDMLRAPAPVFGPPPALPAASQPPPAIAAAAAGDRPDDSIDRFVERLAGGPAQAAAEPLLAPYVAAVADAARLEDVLDRLDAIAADESDARRRQLATLLAEAVFSARVAGETAAGLIDDRDVEAD